jgi:TPP-dependent trihydroxycyclohexane-1,2-dione (THcHDO) dehydratase
MITLSKECKIVRHQVAVAAGATVITPSAGIDMKGFDSCLFIAAFGAIVTGAATSVKVQQSSDDGVADGYSDLTGTSVTVADDQDNKLVYVEVVRPQKRYLKMVVGRATQNSTLDDLTAILSGPKTIPTVHDTSVAVASETWVAPGEGTA